PLQGSRRWLLARVRLLAHRKGPAALPVCQGVSLCGPALPHRGLVAFHNGPAATRRGREVVRHVLDKDRPCVPAPRFCLLPEFPRKRNRASQFTSANRRQHVPGPRLRSDLKKASESCIRFEPGLAWLPDVRQGLSQRPPLRRGLRESSPLPKELPCVILPRSSMCAPRIC